MSAAHGGQVLVSRAAAELVHDEMPNGVTLRDMGERRLKDMIRPEHIYQLVIANLPSDFPPIKTLDVPHHNLPAQITSFIGRETEMLREKMDEKKFDSAWSKGHMMTMEQAIELALEMTSQ